MVLGFPKESDVCNGNTVTSINLTSFIYPRLMVAQIMRTTFYLLLSFAYVFFIGILVYHVSMRETVIAIPILMNRMCLCVHI